MDDKLRILLCEDDENLGMLLREYLQAKGYSAELCPDGDFARHAVCATGQNVTNARPFSAFVPAALPVPEVLSYAPASNPSSFHRNR